LGLKPARPRTHCLALFDQEDPVSKASPIMGTKDTLVM
jgi:hypothetical protein